MLAFWAKVRFRGGRLARAAKSSRAAMVLDYYVHRRSHPLLEADAKRTARVVSRPEATSAPSLAEGVPGFGRLGVLRPDRGRAKVRNW